MSWQDIVFGGGNLVFAIALLPSIFSEHKPALSTSLVTSTVLMAFAVTYASLGLWAGMAMVALNGALWGVLAVQQYRRRRAKIRT